ncbi:MAG: hypothetical protein A2315_06010 [Ignavibacteria bacterium RIFOXYB2_FULL_35_12]|nr:MAG: hypothetical protein A2058_14325 [Ignavibacteria bacterium GWA2_36_19]OGU55312.1 MAG: hypothetical protein A2006_03260 [Ignavibacteria bacterium GWC2_35_8]OGU59299.1 MAG: hypothetical protein A2X60_10720 [Ignavibacteria bacterium GWF2_35_20]OGU78358.1 MAG: hypothetical protein A2254_10110 [Ignavibacteria bacterium RIFOXYA2_FULL_35_9]OGU86508.1 MAG: hypothetical protein A3K31_07540 [Ignavibacteria bacterium RIFOXYA12_FULL_35_25]OGU86868.1 MAG: hypothetical protein A2492_03210 [Ignavibac
MIRDFTEKEIRKAILNKVNPKITHKAKHWKGSIYLDNIFISKVKIPNEHIRVMKEKKSSFIAKSLRLEHDKFNELVECSLKGPQYYKLQKELGT